MADINRHWKTMTDSNSKWFTYAQIHELTGGSDCTVRVIGAKQGLIEQSKRRVVALELEGIEKPLGLNPTNAQSITDLYGTGIVADWVDAKILVTLYIGRDKDPKHPGQLCDCVRVRPKKPTPDMLWNAEPPAYDHATALQMYAEATDEDSIGAAREYAVSHRAPRSAHADLAKAAKAAKDRIAAGKGD